MRSVTVGMPNLRTFPDPPRAVTLLTAQMLVQFGVQCRFQNSFRDLPQQTARPRQGHTRIPRCLQQLPRDTDIQVTPVPEPASDFAAATSLLNVILSGRVSPQPSMIASPTHEVSDSPAPAGCGRR